jgi:hypothetical protein
MSGESRGSENIGMQALRKGTFAIITTHGFEAGEELSLELFESALSLARASETGEVRVIMGDRTLLCLTSGSTGVLIASAKDSRSTWGARRRAEALIRRPSAYTKVLSKQRIAVRRRRAGEP